MKGTCIVAALALAAFAAVCGDSFAITEEEHQSYLRTDPRYAEADRQLREAWDKFSSVATKRHYDQVLEEQREWTRKKDDEIASWVSMTYPEAAAMVMESRAAVLNGLVCAYEGDYVTVALSRGRTVDPATGQDCLEIAAEPSRPVNMAPEYSGLFCGRTGHGRVEQEAVRRIEARQEGRGKTPFEIYPFMPGESSLHLANPLGQEFEVDIYSVSFENAAISCLMHTRVTGLSETFFRLEETVLYDAANDRFMKVEDLFESPGVALALVRSIALGKCAAGIRKNVDDERERYSSPVYGCSFSGYSRNSRLLEGIAGIDLNRMVVRPEGFEVEVDVYPHTGGEPYCRRYGADWPPVVIPFGDLAPAGLKAEYLTSPQRP